MVVISLSWHMHIAICMEWLISFQTHAQQKDV